jgi:hypothetical protein
MRRRGRAIHCDRTVAAGHGGAAEGERGERGDGARQRTACEGPPIEKGQSGATDAPGIGAGRLQIAWEGAAIRFLGSGTGSNRAPRR